MSQKTYQQIALGGTFDHLHVGHQKFIQFAAGFGKKLIIGLTDQKMAGKKSWPDSLQSFADRKKHLKLFCEQLRLDFEIITISDVFGSTLTNNKIESLAVTSETEIGAELINQKRESLGLEKLPVHIFQMIKDESGAEIHSDRIRAGEINRQGKVYAKKLQSTLKLSSEQREQLQQLNFRLVEKPIAKENDLPICVVGDQALKNFRTQNWPYQIGIFDHYIQRKIDIQPLAIQPDFSMKNPAGQISIDLTKVLKKSIQKVVRTKQNQLHVFIEGEEDLAAVALTLLLPLNSQIYFGQPNQGLALINISEEIKDQLLGIVSVSDNC